MTATGWEADIRDMRSERQFLGRKQIVVPKPFVDSVQYNSPLIFTLVLGMDIATRRSIAPFDLPGRRGFSMMEMSAFASLEAGDEV